MAKKEQNGKVVHGDDLAGDLIRLLNQERAERVAYDLSDDSRLSPTHIKRWISTGCLGLDYITSNMRHGGLPEGRIVEIFGPPSIGKSHLLIQVARSTQQRNGIVVYIDTENATQVENLTALGIDTSKRFVFCEASTIEEVFQIAERTVMKAREMAKDVPVTIIWDSIAGTPSEAELKADYDDSQIGAAARAISKGMRKITQTIGRQNVLFLVANQTRTAIGVMYGDPTIVPGGKSVPYHASIRIKLGAGQQIKDAQGRVIGIHVSAKTVKNKVSYPFREAHFEIHFGKGVVEHEQLLDVCRAHCKKNGRVTVGGHDITIVGEGAWKTLEVYKAETDELVASKKFTKSGFAEVMVDPAYEGYVMGLLDELMIVKKGSNTGASIDSESLIEVSAIADALAEDDGLDEVM